MANINLETKDYVLISLDAVFINDDIQSVCQRLNIKRGKYWADPNLGSRLHLLQRSKDLPRNVLLAKQYAEEALLDLVPGRFQSIVVNATQNLKSHVVLKIAVTKLSGQQQTIPYFVPVGN